ncbi:cordon-bleu protein-like 1 isoform X4 [Colletes gigas]|uniref:cordon-bleu protein-like 1 isoform X4 n=1 Tax=Colletes gigas TaxID=935657 RepID=UPI001C9ADAC8|nr:cordon-bleu protein-like 1 isoform X4 [Colletes gigas]
MVLTVTEDTPADMLAGSMELLVQLPREHHHQTQRVTVQRSTPMMDLLVQIVTAHKLSASSYTLQAIGERGMVLPHQPNTPIGALDALQVKLLPKQGTFIPQKTKQANQPFETTFRLQQVHLPRNQLYVSRVSPKMNLGEILDEVCREKNLDRNKYELRHPANLEETLDLSLSLQDYHLQEVTLYAKQGRTLGAALSTQDIMALQRQEERRRQQAKQGVFGFVFKKSKEGSLSTDSLGGRSASPARSDETGRSTSPLYPPTRPQRKRRPAPKPPVQTQPEVSNSSEENAGDSGKEKVVISHSRNSSDSSGYHEASVLSDNPDSAGRLPETLPRRNRVPPESPRKLAHTSQSSKSLGNLATVSGTLSRGISSTSLSSTGLRKKRAAPPPPITRPLSSAMSTQALERIVDSEESLTSDMDPSKPPSDIGVPSKANSDIGMTTVAPNLLPTASNIDQKVPKSDLDPYRRSGSINIKLPTVGTGDPVEDTLVDARAPRKRDANLLETDMLLQKVSATLSHALPHPVSNTVPVDGVCPEETNLEASTISKEKDSFDSKSPTNEDSKQNDYVVMTSTPNLTVNSQDTSDYVSAGDEDLVEWEYQLPAPPTAFRDASPVFDSSQTLVSSTQSYGNPTTEAEKPETSAKRRGPRSTLTEEELLKEESKEKVEEHERLETLQRVKSEDKPDTSDTLERDPRNSFETVEGLLEEKSEEKMKNPEKLEDNSRLEAPQAFKNPRTEKKPNISVKRDLRNSLVASEEGLLEEKFREKLKKRERLDGDSRLEVSQTFRNPNTREDLLENESREKIEQNERLDRQLRLEASQCLRSPNISDEKDPKTPPKTPENLLQEELKKEMEKRERLGDNSRKEPNFDSSTPRVAPTDNTLSNFTITTYTGQQDRFLESKMEDSSDYQEKKSQEPKPKTKELLNRSSNVQRSKSHVPVWDKSKFQGNGADFRGLVDMNNPGTRSNGLNVTRNNEKFSQWRDNSLKRQGEPTKEKQLQSLQVLKTILPQLKNAQQAEENVPKESDDTVLSEKTRSKMAATDSNGDLFRGPIDEKSDSKRSSEPISKHYTYAGPPAIILGSWSERQPANVQIKMDTDYKLGSNEIAPTITSSRTELNHEDSRNRRGNTEKNNGFHGKSGSKDLAKKLIAHTTPLGFKKPHNDDDRPMVTAVELKKSFADDKQDDNVIDTSPMNFKQLSRVFGQEVCLRSKPKRLEANSRKENEPSKGFNAFTESRNGDQRSGLPTMPVITGVTLKSARSKSAVVQDSRDALLESIRNFGGRENLKNAMERC